MEKKEKGVFGRQFLGRDFSGMLDLSHLWVPKNHFWEG